ncbi:LysR family transcriptional regulator [Salmonella enterica subsp. enterica]|nr:LysR family transcriptional regulator [Salmonella enterica subsp. enterica serovar Mikawasima]EDN7229185.1 LysR family transcriptional regulator [Salmonella enterica subsp. enterica serovar Mikawasima]
MGIFLSRKMHYFMVLMDKKNFARAAEELCITRSPLSKVITELEDTLGGMLFYRKHNELEPTDLAWKYYARCKELYRSLLNLENEHKTLTHSEPVKIRFDVSVPEIFVRHINMIAKAENLDITIMREMITVDDLSSFPLESNQAIFSLRPLSGASLSFCDSWEGSKIVKLHSTATLSTDECNRIFVWKDQFESYFKNRYTYLLKDNITTPDFIEHNFDIATLLFMVRTGKGNIITTEKFAQWYKADGIVYDKLEHHSRCYFYHNENKKLKASLTALKYLIGKFI